MQEVKVDKTKANIGLLDEQLRTALGNKCSGLSASRGVVTVHMDDTSTPSDIAQAQQIVIDHDETGLTAEQQKQEQLKTDIAADRELYTDKFNPATITLEALAQRVLWLENELRELRGL